MVFQFGDGETRVVAKIPMEKTSNAMPIIFGTDFHRSYGQIAKYRAQASRNRLSHKFWKHWWLFLELKAKATSDFYSMVI
jgi:hypothetical protein